MKKQVVLSLSGGISIFNRKDNAKGYINMSKQRM